MAERISALASLAPQSHGTPLAVLSELRPAAILQVQAWPDTLEAVESTLSEMLELSGMPPAGSAGWFHNGSLCALGTGRFMVSTTSDAIAESLRIAFAADQATVTDVTHGRTVLRLEGAAAAELLSRCVALDLDAAAFPADRVAQTAIHHVDVLIHRLTDTSFEIWTLRSFAASLAEWMIDAGAEIGVRFEGGQE